MNENQPTTSSKRGSSKLSASKQRKQKKKQERRRVSDFAKVLSDNNGQQTKNNNSEQQQLPPPSHSSALAAPQEGNVGNDESGVVMSFFDHLAKQPSVSTNQQNNTASENQTTTVTSLPTTQDMAEYCAKESSSSQGSSSRLTQDTMGSNATDDNSSSFPAVAQTNTINSIRRNTDNSALRAQADVQRNKHVSNESKGSGSQLSRMGSMDSAVAKPSPITAEQKARMEANKLAALRRRHMKEQGPMVAQKPHPREVMGQFREESNTASATKYPSRESMTSSRTSNSQIASQKPSLYGQQPIKLFAQQPRETTTTSAATTSSRQSMTSSRTTDSQIASQKPSHNAQHSRNLSAQQPHETTTTSAATTSSRESMTSSRTTDSKIASHKSRHNAKHSGNLSAPQPRETTTTSAATTSSRESMTSSTQSHSQMTSQKSSHRVKRNKEETETPSLTQIGFVIINEPKKQKVEHAIFPTDMYYATWHRGNRNVSFKKGDVWYSDRSRFAGWAFLIDHIDLERGGVHVAHVHAFLKLEKTFIGQQEAAQLEHTDWVLVKKHDNLPTDGHIQVKDLSTRMMSQNIPFHMHLALRYEEVGDTVVYYVKKGKQISSSSNNQLKPRFCDCFAGGGGMSAGIRATGFFSEKSYKIELDKEACETLRANFPDSTVFQMDIRDLVEKYRRGMMNLWPSLVYCLHLSPPCQGFSRVNTSGGCKDIQNNNLTLACIEAVKLLKPTHLTMENVPGILDEKTVSLAERTKKSYLQEFICGLLSQDYQVRLCKKLNAKSFGDPQDRERVILFASKKGYALPSSPLPIHGNEPHLKKIVTVRDVLSDLECIEPTQDGRVWLNDGTKARGHYIEGTTLAKNKHEPDEELQPDLPARTVRKKNRLVHYNRERNLTVLERARLMSFPDDYVFEGNHGEQKDQIGNAVPVRFAAAIATAVMESFRLGLHEPPNS